MEEFILFYRSHIVSCTPIGLIEHQKRRRVINLFVSFVAFRLRTTLVCIRIGLKCIQLNRYIILFDWDTSAGLEIFPICSSSCRPAYQKNICHIRLFEHLERSTITWKRFPDKRLIFMYKFLFVLRYSICIYLYPFNIRFKWH